MNRLLTPVVMFDNYILRAASIDTVPYTAIVSGIEKSGKTSMLQLLLSKAILTKHKKNMTPLLEQALLQQDNECLACYKIVLLGLHPLKQLTWLLSTPKDIVVMCFLSYFARLCKQHGLSRPIDWYSLLHFAASEEGSVSTSDPDLDEQIRSLHADLRKQWGRLECDENMQAVMPTGVGLLNVYDIGPSKAAKEFLPFINKYCKRALNIACYNSENDAPVLKKELLPEDEAHQHGYQSRKYQLLRQLCGIHKEEALILAAIGKQQQKPQSKVDELTDAIKETTGIEQVHHLFVSPQTMAETKSKLEHIAVDGRYDIPMQLRFILLLDIIVTKCKNFWMKRSEIDSISKLYKFQNGELEAFLRFFASFGSIFYTHDIPRLREYVIINVVQFVEHIHTLYTSNEDTANFGLFKHRDNEDWRVIFQFLTTLGIATEVKSNHIDTDNTDLVLDSLTSYYYIPTARHSFAPSPLATQDGDSCRSSILAQSESPSSSRNRGSQNRGTQNESPTLQQNENEGESSSPGSRIRTSPVYYLLPVKGHTKENLQASLSKHLLQNKQCLLIPTTDINTTAMKVSFISPCELEFIDSGNRLIVRSLRGQEITCSAREAIKQMIASNDPTFLLAARARKTSRQQVIDTIKEIQTLQGKCNTKIICNVLIN